MKEYCFTVECEQKALTVRYNSRELTFIVLGEPLIQAAEDFKRAIGLWDNFSVANGMNVHAWTTKPREQLLLAAEDFLATIAVDRELLQYDYQYGFSSIPKQKNSAGMGAGKVGGRSGTIFANHPGQVFLQLWETGADGKGKIVETKDLRKGPPVVSEELGTIKIYRRRNKVDWEPKLIQLVEFLRPLKSENVRIRHHYPE